MEIEAFFDPQTWTLTYVVWDPDTRDAVVIDPVLDYDPRAVKVSTESIDRVLAFVREHGLDVHYVLDTHAHADHLSGFQKLRDELGAKIGIGSDITAVQETFREVFNLGDDFKTDGSQWDVLLEDGKPVQAGSLTIEPIHTPGHTPACMTYKIRDAIFTGDTMFMPDFGTGRCDFPGGSAEQLYDSIQKLYALPDTTRVFVGHDYQPGGRELEYETTIAACKADNKQLRGDTSKAEFVEWRTARDATLQPPALIFQSLQVNANAGVLPAPEDNGLRYLKMPMGVF
jgi:glyoxylase-like metal-dependent hydrolase (beta-lactamase superfamily II)